MTQSGLRSFARGSAATFAGQLAQMVLGLVSVVVLSRLLPPADFGLIAMVAVVTSLGVLLRDLGLGVAALRAPVLEHQQASNLFWVNAALSLVTGAGIALSGPVLSAIYHEPRLQVVAPALSISFVLSGLQAQIQVSLARAKKFGTLATITATSKALGLATAIVLALLGWGYWALIVEAWVVALSDFVLKWTAARWSPSRPRKGAGTRKLVSSGADYAGAGFIQYLASNADTFTLGARWGATDVGLYSRAKQLYTLPLTFLSPLVNVAVPTMNDARARGESVQSHLLKLQAMFGTWIVLLYVGTAASAPSLFDLALGHEWVGAAPAFQLLAFGGAVKAIEQVNWWAFLVIGSSREQLKYNMVSQTGTAALVVLGALHSIEGAAFALSLSFFLSWLLSVHWLKVTAGLRAREFYWGGLRVLATGLVATAGTLILFAVAPAELNLLWATLAKSLLAGGSYLLLTGLTKEGRESLRSTAALFHRSGR